MGFSVSGAAAIIFASMFIAFGMWFTAASNSFDRVTDAQDIQTEGALSTSNTDLDIVDATYETDEDGGGTLTIEADNTGTTELSLAGTDLLIDGEFVDGWEGEATVESNSETDLWLEGERLVITVDRAEQPDRVKLITETGVSASAPVEEEA